MWWLLNFHWISLRWLTHVCMNTSAGTRNRTENENCGKGKTIYFAGSASLCCIEVMKLRSTKYNLRCQVCRNLQQNIWIQEERTFRFNYYISGLKLHSLISSQISWLMPVVYWHFNECLSTQNIIASTERMLGCAAKVRWIGWEHESGWKERSSRFQRQSVKWSDSHKNFTQGCGRHAWATGIYDNQINNQFTKTCSFSFIEVIIGKPHSILQSILLSPNVTPYRLQ